jgi:hypothetical protein
MLKEGSSVRRKENPLPECFVEAVDGRCPPPVCVFRLELLPDPLQEGDRNFTAIGLVSDDQVRYTIPS